MQERGREGEKMKERGERERWGDGREREKIGRKGGGGRGEGEEWAWLRFDGASKPALIIVQDPDRAPLLKISLLALPFPSILFHSPHFHVTTSTGSCCLLAGSSRGGGPSRLRRFPPHTSLLGYLCRVRR